MPLSCLRGRSRPTPGSPAHGPNCPSLAKISIDFRRDPAVAIPPALAAARRAVEIDPGDAAAHAALAWALAMQGNFAASEAELDTALRLNPGDAGILARFRPGRRRSGTPSAVRRPPITRSGSIQPTEILN